MEHWLKSNHAWVAQGFHWLQPFRGLKLLANQIRKKYPRDIVHGPILEGYSLSSQNLRNLTSVKTDQIIYCFQNFPTKINMVH